MWTEIIQAVGFFLCIYFAYRGCRQDFEEANVQMPFRRSTPKQKICEPSKNTIQTVRSEMKEEPPSYSEVMNT